MTLILDIDLDLDKVFRTRLGSYLTNCWADHHYILTHGRWYPGLSDKAIKSRAVFTCDVRGTFKVRDWVPETVFPK